MRRVILDHARKHGADKRGGGQRHLSLEQAGEITVASAGDLADLAALDQALAELARHDATAAAVVELRFFGGMTVEETAAVLELSTATIGRQWRAARAWLHDRLQQGGVGAAGRAEGE
jgi:RNA polymerase sigma factor (TIGR02999 family)